VILTVGEAAFVIAIGTQTVSRTQEQRACWVITSEKPFYALNQHVEWHNNTLIFLHYACNTRLTYTITKMCTFTSRPHRTELYPTMQSVFKSALSSK